jgi:basic membrane protein A
MSVQKWVRYAALIVAVAMVAMMLGACATNTKSPDSGATTTGGESDIKAAMVTDIGGLGDKSFNDLSAAGLDKAKADFGVETTVLESKEAADYESNIQQLVSAGYNPIFAVGFLMTDTVVKLAPTYPDTYFAGVDEYYDPVPANAVGLNFKEQEGSYLAGVVAGLATKDTFSDKLNADNVIGFVGGMDVPLIKKFEAGFIAGAKSVNPDVKVVSLYTGNFTDQAKGKELGLSLIEQKADVIYAAAGACGLGTIQACQEKGALFIGVDADQYLTVPGSGDVMLTSMMKRVDNAVFETIKLVVEDKFPAGQLAFFGLAEGGVDLAPFHDFESVIPQTITDAVDKAREDIISGTVVVPETP